MVRTAAIGLLLLASCSRAPEQAPGAEDFALNRRLLEIAREYPHYGTVDLKFAWVQTLCRLPPVYARLSDSDEGTGHGGKIYLLYAKDWKAYVPGIERDQPVGQVIVKEAWEPVEVPQSRAEGFHEEGNRYPVEPAVRNGKRFDRGAKHGLFIMLKDEAGWRYGTVTPEGDRVLQAGRIRSCLECHRDAKPDSLFGMPGRPQDH